jgi:YfiH family protein
MILNQIHGQQAITLNEVIGGVKADGMVTDRPNIVLGIQTADCPPILFYSPQGVIGAAHGGWKSLSKDIVEHTVRKMVSLGAKRDEIVALLGPCIRVQSYQTRQDFYDHLCRLSAQNEMFFTYSKESEDLYYFDLPEFAKIKLAKSQITKIIDSGKNTYTDAKYFSRRRSLHQGYSSYGTQLSVIML